MNQWKAITALLMGVVLSSQSVSAMQAASALNETKASSLDLYKDWRAEAVNEAVNNVPLEGEKKIQISSSEKTDWENRLKAAENKRTGLITGGVISLAVGVGFTLSGLKDINDAGDTPGCVQDGFEVICSDAESTEAAQDKIDDGQLKLLVSILFEGMGIGLGAWGISTSPKVNRLRREGKEKGFVMELSPIGDGGKLAYYRKF